jgi:hypothetical protein
MRYPFNLILLCYLFIISCGTTKKISDSGFTPIAFDKITVDSVLNRINNNQDIDYLTAKGDLDYEDKDVSLSGNLSVYDVRDSAYLIVIKKLGIELSRILITKDSFKILNRINQTYSVNSLDNMSNSYKLPLHFKTIHQLLTSACYIDSHRGYELKKELHQFSLLKEKTEPKLNYKLDSIHLLPYSFEALNNNQQLVLTVNDHKSVGGKWIPSDFELQVSKVTEKLLHVHVKWDELNLKPISGLKFNIPDNYTNESE